MVEDASRCYMPPCVFDSGAGAQAGVVEGRVPHLTHGAQTSRKVIKRAFDTIQDHFEVTGSLTVEEGTELLRSNLRLHRRGKAELQLDFLSGLMLLNLHG